VKVGAGSLAAINTRLPFSGLNLNVESPWLASFLVGHPQVTVYDPVQDQFHAPQILMGTEA
jgi:hypothetical protein